MNIQRAFKCPACSRVYSSLRSAEVCCSVVFGYWCGSCGNFHEDTDKAEKCCTKKKKRKAA